MFIFGNNVEINTDAEPIEVSYKDLQMTQYFPDTENFAKGVFYTLNPDASKQDSSVTVTFGGENFDISI